MSAWDETADFLWEGIRLPEWDPEMLAAHFARQMNVPPLAPDGSRPVLRPLDDRERDHFTRQLMCLIALRFSTHRFLARLPQLGLDVRDVASDTLTFLLEKVPRITIKAWDDRPAMSALDRYLILLSLLNLTIYRRVMTTVQKRQDHLGRGEVLATDSIRRRARDGDIETTLDYMGTSKTSFPNEPRAARALLRSAKDQVCGGIPGNLVDILLHFRLQKSALLDQGALLAYHELPPKMASRVDPEMHFAMVTKLRSAMEAILR